mmetsp:Transcript_47204/g.140904  ORF Transcript_47204/g.140904 Transcript_47204/m.140904 type:complete len:202 (+) Transcript_47204:388-993(+)
MALWAAAMELGVLAEELDRWVHPLPEGRGPPGQERQMAGEVRRTHQATFQPGRLADGPFDPGPLPAKLQSEPSLLDVADRLIRRVLAGRWPELLRPGELQPRRSPASPARGGAEAYGPRGLADSGPVQELRQREQLLPSGLGRCHGLQVRLLLRHPLPVLAVQPQVRLLRGGSVAGVQPGVPVDAGLGLQVHQLCARLYRR